MKYNPKIFDRI